ncbi:MAG: ATP synthase F1 subunit epsilon [Marinilabiliales bacterium]|nr:MAG: ATP synthase F1 subunit epsilon [Marinilabiliales bacterium]
MLLEIISPETTLYSGEVKKIVFPGQEGSFGVLENHAPMIAALQKGDVEFETTDGKEEKIEVKGGVVEILNNKVLVLAE